ncbi:MAG: ABC transporter permease [Candidatus Desulforudis sp.]|nr:ABC transporter permease [Desulforudis sp.]
MRMDLSPLSVRVFQRHLTVFARTWKTSVALNFFEPLLYLLALGVGLGVYVRPMEGLPYLNYLAPGLVAASAMFATTYECTYGTFVRFKYQKTFQAMVATPLSMDDVVLGEVLWGVFKSMLYGTIILFVIFVLGLVPSAWALLIPLVMVLGGFQFALLSMLWTGLVPNIDSFHYFFSLIITPLFLFSGVFFPLADLHPAVQTLAWCSPLYHIVVLTRALATGDIAPFLLYNVLWLIAVSALLFPFAAHLMRRLVIR